MMIFTIIVITIVLTVVATMFCFSCVITNGIQEKQDEAYRRGFEDGKKSV